MGGSVFVGIKQNDKIHLMERYTNNFPYWFSDPDFQNGGIKVQEYLNLERDKEFMKPQTMVHPSQYGVILIDFDSKKVLSRQSYTKIDYFLMEISFDPDSDSEEIKLIQKMLDRDVLEGFYISTEHGLKKINSEVIFQAIKEVDYTKRNQILLTEGVYSHVYVKFKTELEINCISYEAQHVWKEVISWLKENNWGVKYMPVSTVKKKYGVDL